MSKIVKNISLLPAKNIKESVKFYESIGFKDTYTDGKRHNAYAVMDNGLFEIQLYAFKKLPVPTPTNIYLYIVTNIDDIYTTFKQHYKESTGRTLSASGLPRIGKPRNLRQERRFTLTDIDGNYLIFVEDLDEETFKETDNKLEDMYVDAVALAYSHETPKSASKLVDLIIRNSQFNDISDEFKFQIYVLGAEMYYELEQDDKVDKLLSSAHDLLSTIDYSKVDNQSLEIYKEVRNRFYNM